MWTRAFWKAVVERAVKTFAQTLGGTLTAAGITNLFGLFAMDRTMVAVIVGPALFAAFYSVLTSLASSLVGGEGPSLAGEVLADPEPEPASSDDDQTAVIPQQRRTVEYDGLTGADYIRAAYGTPAEVRRRPRHELGAPRHDEGQGWQR